MHMATFSFDGKTVPLLEVLTDPTGKHTIGFKLGGFKPGPNLLVAGHAPVADRVFERLTTLPTLGWMRGSLTLILLTEMERYGGDVYMGGMLDPKPDELHFLAYHLDPAHQDAAVTEGYWSTLQLCVTLGMISGRGIPKK
jgi:hypothetical protein